MPTDVLIPWKEVVQMISRSLSIRFPEFHDKLCTFNVTDGGLIVHLTTAEELKKMPSP